MTSYAWHHFGDAFASYYPQVSAMADFPPGLAALLQDPSLPKVGIGISNDAFKLRADYGVVCAGLVDLSQVVAAALPKGARPWSLVKHTT